MKITLGKSVEHPDGVKDELHLDNESVLIGQYSLVHKAISELLRENEDLKSRIAINERFTLL